MKRLIVLVCCLLLPALPAAAQMEPREPISVMAAPAAFPLAVAAAEQFSLKNARPMPVVELNDTATAIALFCAGSGARFPDALALAGRPSRDALSACARHGAAVSELLLGHQAVVLAQGKGGGPGGVPLRLTHRQLFLALAREVPVNGRPAPNPYRLWSDIDFSLPVAPIAVIGPPPLTPERDALTDLVMAPAIAAFPALKGRDPALLRDDGAFVEVAADMAAGELARRPGSFAVLSFNAFAASGGLGAVPIDGVAPQPASIAGGQYPLARPFLLYVKQAHAGVIPGLKDYLAETAGPAAAGPGGYLTRRGLVPLPPRLAAPASGAGVAEPSAAPL